MYAFSFETLSRAFSNRCVFDENANAKRISVSGRPRRIEMHAFSNENALMCTGFKSMSLDINYDIACEQVPRGALAAGREEKGELATTSLEFEFHLQSPWLPVDWAVRFPSNSVKRKRART